MLTNEELEVTSEELRERQRQLDALANYQRMVLASIGLGLIVLDDCARVTSWNRQTEQIFARSEVEMLGRDFFALDLGFSTRELEEPLNAVMQGSPLERRRIDTLDSRGRGLLFDVRMSRLLGPAKEVRGATMIIDSLPAKQRATRRMSKENRRESQP